MIVDVSSQIDCSVASEYLLLYVVWQHFQGKRLGEGDELYLVDEAGDADEAVVLLPQYADAIRKR